MSKQNKEKLGFIGGYHAKNLASAQDTIKYKLEEFQDLLEDIELKSGNNVDLLRSIKRLKKLLNETSPDDSDLISKFIALGELMKTSLSNLKETDSEKTRLIVLNFGQIAKLANDKNLKELAVDLGNQYLG
jgi:hypothetical protein